MPLQMSVTPNNNASFSLIVITQSTDDTFPDIFFMQ